MNRTLTSRASAPRRALRTTAPLLAALVAAGCGTAAGSDPHHAESAQTAAGAHAGGHGHHGPRTLEVLRPLRQDTELTRDYVCQIHASQRVELRALEEGYLEEIFVDEGQTVRQGQPMFQVMTQIYQAEFDMAKAEAEAARIEYGNTKLLADEQVVSDNELALAKARLDMATAEQQLRDAHRGLTSIKAPFDGIMGLLEVRRGSLLEEGELLTTLSDNRTMWVYFNVTEAEYYDYVTHRDDSPTQVRLELAHGKLFDEAGTIETIEADFNNETGTIAFRATFPNPNGVLRHGSTGKVLLTRVVEDAQLIPQKATYEILDATFVFVVDEQGGIHQRRIEVAAELPHLYVVSSGLADDERILLDGLNLVRDGDTITAVDRDAAEVFEQLELPAD